MPKNAQPQPPACRAHPPKLPLPTDPTPLTSLLKHTRYQLLGWLSGKESACDTEDVSSIPGLGSSPGEGKWQPTPVFLPGKSQGWNSLVGYSPWGRKRVGHDLATKQQQQITFKRTSLVVQWLRIHPCNSIEGGFNPWWGTKIPNASEQLSLCHNHWSLCATTRESVRCKERSCMAQ